MSIRIFSKLALAMAVTASSVSMAASLEAVNPAVRAMPPGAPASGAYVTLVNHSEQERFLIGAESTAAENVEIHVSEMQGDTMMMNRVEQIAVPAHGQTELKPGGYHIMMMGLVAPLKAGDHVDFTLVMKNGERIPMQAPVLSPDEMAKYMPSGMSMKHMDHSKMDHGSMSHDKEHKGHNEMGEHSAHH